MKNSFSSITSKIASRYLLNEDRQSEVKSTDINILLNRVKLDQKRESRKKIVFSGAACFGVLLFGFIIF